MSRSARAAVLALLVTAAWPAGASAAPAAAPKVRWYRVVLEVRHVQRTEHVMPLGQGTAWIIPGTPRLTVLDDYRFTLRSPRPVQVTRTCVPRRGSGRRPLPGGRCPRGAQRGYRQVLSLDTPLAGIGPTGRVALRTTHLVSWTCVGDGITSTCTHAPCSTIVERTTYDRPMPLVGTLELSGPPGGARLAWRIDPRRSGSPPRAGGVARQTGTGAHCTTTLISPSETLVSEAVTDPYELVSPGGEFLGSGLHQPWAPAIETSERNPGIDADDRASRDLFDDRRTLPTFPLGRAFARTLEQTADSLSTGVDGDTLEVVHGSRVTVRFVPCPDRGGTTRRGCYYVGGERVRFRGARSW